MKTAQTTEQRIPVSRSWLPWAVAGVLLALVAGALYYVPGWRPDLAALKLPGSPLVKTESPTAGDAHAGHEGHAHGSADSLEMSPQAQKNIGLKLAKVEVRDFERTITIPGLVVEWQGQSQLEVTAPLTGIVTRVYPLSGEAVKPGQPLFDLRLTHEELVQAQANFLQTAEELDVIRREVARIEIASKGGAIAGKTLLERLYEQQKQEASLRAQKQALVLHGLTPAQIEDILSNRTLFQKLTVEVPAARQDASGVTQENVLQVQEIKVERGQHVNVGDTLAELTDHAQLLIEGDAFEQDVADLQRAADEAASVSALLENKSGRPTIIAGLKILYLGGKIDPGTRTFHFYVTLPNKLQRKSESNGHQFVDWQYRPGQRMQLQVSVERWKERIVLPVEAVAKEGPENYVFLMNGNRFERRPVHIEYIDPLWAVIANDGSVFPGETVAVFGAQQMHLAIKNKAGGAIDPHAGHNH